MNLVSLQVLSAQARPNGPGGESASVTLSGLVANPGLYPLASLQAFPASTETVKGDPYTGVPILTLLGASDPNIFSQYVLAGATDGYEVLFSLAELRSKFRGASNLDRLDVAAVPEPGTVALLILGLIGIALKSQRRTGIR